MSTAARIGALVPIRLASERLPGKALLPLEGRPVVTHLIDRLAATRSIAREHIVICTTTDATDDALVPVVTPYGARVYRGSRDDIIDRLQSAAAEYRFDAVIQADGDDPCVDPDYMDRCMDRLLADEALGAVSTEGLPLGIGTKAIRASALDAVCAAHLTTRNDTGFGYYFTRTELCRSTRIGPVSDAHRHETARFTLDYEEDYVFFQALFRELYRDGEVFSLTDALALLERRPELVAINTGRSQEYWQRTAALTHLEYQWNGRTVRVEP